MNYALQRERMVREQLIPRGIGSRRVLDAFGRVERHEFVPANVRGSAYADHPLPIGAGQTISQPYIAALMTEKLSLRETDRVLEIGTCSGYQAAILAELTETVYSVERIGALAEKSAGVLERLGYRNVRVKTADGTLGWIEQAPFNRIIVTEGAPGIPESLVSQLSDPGIMIIPVGSGFGQVLTLILKEDKKVSWQEVCGCAFVPLVGREGWEET